MCIFFCIIYVCGTFLCIHVSFDMVHAHLDNSCCFLICSTFLYIIPHIIKTNIIRQWRRFIEFLNLSKRNKRVWIYLDWVHTDLRIYSHKPYDSCCWKKRSDKTQRLERFTYLQVFLHCLCYFITLNGVKDISEF